MASSVEPVRRLVLRAGRRLAAAAVADALAPPAAGFLLVAAGVLAAARASGREDLPRGLLAAAAILALLAAFARLARGLPGTAAAAAHLDRALGAGERFATVMETAESDPAIAEWAARGALARAGEGPLRDALALRPPAALLPLILAAVVVAGLGLLPAEAAGEASPASTPVAAPSASGGGTASANPSAASAGPAASSLAPSAVLEGLEAKARAAANDGALAALAEARAAFDRGDEGGGDAAIRRALSALGVPAGAAAGGGDAVPGATGGGAASTSGGARPAAAEEFRPLPVPLRAREAVRRYFGNGE